MELTDDAWYIIQPLLPKRPTGKRGRPWWEHREVLDVILWIFRTGVPWKDLPDEYPPYQTCHRRFGQWSTDGTLAKVLQAIARQLENRRCLNVSECCIDAKFIPAKKRVNVLGKPSAVKGRS